MNEKPLKKNFKLLKPLKPIKPKKNILFLTLKVFSATGGIEKVCKVIGKAIYSFSVEEKATIRVLSMYDQQEDADDNRYFTSDIFKGFGKSKMKFIVEAIWMGRKKNHIVLSHINLLLVGRMIKLINPSAKIILIAHGIEVWGKLSWIQQRMLTSIDTFVSVSQFTSMKLQENHQIDPLKCKVINNCLDPFIPNISSVVNEDNIRMKYGFTNDQKVMLTLTRISSKERYKGYDRVIEAMVNLIPRHPQLRYLLAGKYDSQEKQYLDQLIAHHGLKDFVVIPGFVSEEELDAHFSLADLYVMPSIKEGFGIVFIEAMHYGLPVIAGNMDGSVDALINGALGTLVNPLDTNDIEIAIDNILNDKNKYLPNEELLMESFGYDEYKRKLGILLSC